MNAGLRRKLVAGAICLGTTLVFSLLHGRLAPLEALERHMTDLRLAAGRTAPVHPDLVLLAVDRASYADDFPAEELIARASPEDQKYLRLLREEYPWTREVWAKLADKLMAAGARGVVFDFMFGSQTPVDESFKQVIERHSPKVVLGSLVDVSESGVRFAGPNPSLVVADELGRTYADGRVGFLNLHTDADGLVRRGLFTLTTRDVQRLIGTDTEIAYGDVHLKSLAARAAALLRPGTRLPDDGTRPLLRFAGPVGTFRPVSLKSVFDPAEWRSRFADTGFFKDKLVLVGPTASMFENTHRTVFARHGALMGGPEVHLNQINALLQNGFIAETSLRTERILLAGIGVVTLVLTLLIRDPVWRIFPGVLFSALHLGVSIWLHNQHGLMLQAVVSPVLLINVCNFGTFLADYRARARAGGEPAI